MRRIGVIVAASIALILGAGTVLAQHGGHVVSTPDMLKWVEPPTFPGARLVLLCQ